MVIDLNVEREHWTLHASKRGLLVGMSLGAAWPHCMRVYSMRISYPRIAKAEARATFEASTRESVMSAPQAAQLFELVWARMDDLMFNSERTLRDFRNLRSQ